MDESKEIGIFNRIGTLMPEFTNSEKKVARFILAEKQNITNMSILDIAQGASVSEASVMRFCGRLGIRKLIDLRIQIAKDADSGRRTGVNPLGQLENDYIDIVHNTSSLIDPKNVSACIEAIESCTDLCFCGIAASGIAARVGADSFSRMGVQARALTEGHYQMMHAAMMDGRGVFVALSLSGNTRDICESAQTAKESGAFVIAITSYTVSQLARIADIVLLTSAKEDIINGGKITGCVSQLYVIDCLKREYEARHSEHAALIKERLAQSIIVKKY